MTTSEKYVNQKHLLQYSLREQLVHGMRVSNLACGLAKELGLQVMPSEDEFPYTVRVVSEVLESNGSSSQATICAGCMSIPVSP